MPVGTTKNIVLHYCYLRQVIMFFPPTSSISEINLIFHHGPFSGGTDPCPMILDIGNFLLLSHIGMLYVLRYYILSSLLLIDRKL